MSEFELIKGASSLNIAGGISKTQSCTGIDTLNQEYGVHETFKYGDHQAKDEITTAHPLENVLKNHDAKRWATINSARMLAFGMHMPLASAMELDTFRKISNYGPPLSTNTIFYDTLTRKDINIEFEDVLGNQYKKYDICPRQKLEYNYGLGPSPGRFMF